MNIEDNWFRLYCFLARWPMIRHNARKLGICIFLCWHVLKRWCHGVESSWFVYNLLQIYDHNWKEILFQCHTDRICNFFPTFCCLLCIYYQAATQQIAQEILQTVFLCIATDIYQEHFINNILLAYCTFYTKLKQKTNWKLVRFFNTNLSLICEIDKGRKCWQNQFLESYL